jgi:DNA-binding response OmpR family regulator
MLRADEPLRAAVVDGDAVRGAALAQRMARRGYGAMPFHGATGLLKALQGGWRFDLLLLHPEHETAWADLSAACRLQRMPMLLLAEDSAWRTPPAVEALCHGHGLVDFAPLPLADHELEWRLRALLSRSRTPARPSAEAQELVCGDYRLLAPERLVLRRGREVRLDPREFDLALMLFRHLGQLLTREFLWIALWKRPPHEGARALNIAAASVRKKLALQEDGGLVLRAAYGRGYMLQEVRSQAEFACEPAGYAEA